MPLIERNVSIGSGPQHPIPTSTSKWQHVQVAHDPFASRLHVELKHSDGSVFAIGRSRSNDTFLNGLPLVPGKRVKVERDPDNRRFQLSGEDADAPMLFLVVPNRQAAEKLPDHTDCFTGFTLRMNAQQQPPRSQPPQPEPPQVQPPQPPQPPSAKGQSSSAPAAATSAATFDEAASSSTHASSSSAAHFAVPHAASTSWEAAAASSTSIAPLPDLSRNQWVSKKAGMWACAKQEVQEAPAGNLFLAGEFDKLAETYESLGGQENTWKAFALSRQAKILRQLGWEVTSSSVGRLNDVPKFGKKGVDKARELLASGRLQRLEMLKESERVQAIEALTKVHGVGAATAKEWYARGYRTIEDALAAGIMSGQQLVGARHWKDLTQRIPRDEVAEIIQMVQAALEAALIEGGVSPECVACAADAIGAGSYRRASPAPVTSMYSSQGVTAGPTLD